MKYKVGDMVKFVKDCALETGEAIPANSIWIVREVRESHYILERTDEHLVAMIGHKTTDDNCEKINTAPSVTKRINDKHHILNGLLNSDGSVDGEKLMEKLSNQSNASNVEHPSHYTDGIECYKYINSHNLNFNVGNIIKYGTRYLLKNKPIEDLRKVQQYAEYEIERLKELGYKE